MAAGSAVVWPAAAQTNALPSSQPIIFSMPAGEKAATNAPSLWPRLSDRPNFANELRAPVSVFTPPTRFLPLATRPPVPARSRAETQRLKKLLEERENWALLTPEEILGLDMPENTLRTPGQAGADNQKELTVEERFLERQRHSHMAVTNGYRNDDSSSGWVSIRNQAGLTNAGWLDPARMGLPGAAQIWDRFLNNTPANRLFAGQNEDQSARWFKSLGLPPQPAAPTPEQLAERERFKQLLDPDSSFNATANTLSGDKFFPSPRPLSDTAPNKTPAMNPVVPSLGSLSSGIGRPSGLTPLPGIAGPTNAQPSAALPAWAPQPPPWLVQTPQPFTMPQRKF